MFYGGDFQRSVPFEGRALYEGSTKEVRRKVEACQMPSFRCQVSKQRTFGKFQGILGMEESAKGAGKPGLSMGLNPWMIQGDILQGFRPTRPESCQVLRMFIGIVREVA